MHLVKTTTPGIQILTLLINPMPCCISARLWRFTPVVGNVLYSFVNSAEPLHCSTSRPILLLIAGTKRGVHSLQVHVQVVTSTTLLTALSRTLFQAPAATAFSVFDLPKKHKKLMTCELSHSCTITCDYTKLPCPKTRRWYPALASTASADPYINMT